MAQELLRQSGDMLENATITSDALLAVIPCEEFDSLNDAFDYYRDHRDKSLKLIKTAPPCQD